MTNHRSYSDSIQALAQTASAYNAGLGELSLVNAALIESLNALADEAESIAEALQAANANGILTVRREQISSGAPLLRIQIADRTLSFWITDARLQSSIEDKYRAWLPFHVKEYRGEAQAPLESLARITMTRTKRGSTTELIFPTGPGTSISVPFIELLEQILNDAHDRVTSSARASALLAFGRGT